MHAISCKHFEMIDLAALVKPVVARMLPGSVEPEETIRVDVHVRSYDDSASLAPHQVPIESKTGRLPVGTILDCYV